MDKQKEIEKMACDMCRWRHVCSAPNEPIDSCKPLHMAKKAVEAGYGDVRVAVKEFVSNLQNAIVINELIRNKNERMVVFAEIEELVKEYENELFGKTEQVNHEKGDVRR